MFRRGQWVKTTRDLNVKVEVAGQQLTVTIPAPSIGIHNKLETNEPPVHEKVDGQEVLNADGQPNVLYPARPGRSYHSESSIPKVFEKGEEGNLVGLSLVDPETGMNTILDVAVPADAIEAVTDINDIPEHRRKTAPEGWTPRA